VLLGCTARLGERDEPTVLATGGFAASPELVARHVAPAAPLPVRGNLWSTGDGLRHALGRGAALTPAMNEFYGRNMPDRAWAEDELVSASQLYARSARIFDGRGDEFFLAEDVSWSETNVVQATAQRPGARAYYVLTQEALRRPEVAAKLDAAGEARLEPRDLPFEPPPRTAAGVRVVAAITHTIGGLRVDERARVLRADNSAINGLFAAGVDAGGVATGGYASGLAQALVLGLVAAEEVVR